MLQAVIEDRGVNLPPLAFSTLGCPDWTFEEIVEHGVDYGYDGVEIRLLRRETNLLARPEFDRNELSRRRRQLADENFQVCGLASSVYFHDVDAGVRAQQIATGRAYCDLACELGARFVRVFGDLLNPPGSPAAKPADELSETELAEHPTVARIAEGLNQLGEYAEMIGVQILLETHGDFCRTPAIVAVMQRVERSAVGVLWDSHHAWRFHQEPLRLTFQQLHQWIGHVHWKDSVTRHVVNAAADAANTAAEQLVRQTNPGHQHADYVLFGGGEFPIRRCISLFAQPQALETWGPVWHCLEWEKMWHPHIEDPEVALKLFPKKFNEFWCEVTG